MKLLQYPLTAYTVTVAQDAPFVLRVAVYRFQEKLQARYGVTLPKESDRTVSVRIDPSLPLADYRVTATERGLSVAGGHYAAAEAALARLWSLWEKRDGELFSQEEILCGTCDVPLTWHNDGSASALLSQAAPEDAYTLVWNDEFDGTKIDYEKWSGHPNMGMPKTALRFDEAGSDSVSVADGKLILKTDVADPVERTYTSNLSVTTHDTMNFSGGYLEMRAKVPFKAMGEWPSFWSGSYEAVLFKRAYRDAHGGKRYDAGYRVEVDFFEQFSSADTVVPNLHKWFRGVDTCEKDYVTAEGKPLPTRVQLSGIDAGASISGTRGYTFQGKDGKSGQEIANEWHTYGFLWTDDLMAFSVDGQFYYAYSMRDEDQTRFNPTFYHKETGEARVFDMGGYQKENMALSIMLNNMFFPEGYAKPDSWAHKWCVQAARDKELFPLLYEVDYLRLYQCDKDFLYTPKTVGNGKMRFCLADYAYEIDGKKSPTEMS